MATCPRCKEFLNENHVCPAQWPRMLRWASSLGLGMIAGGIVGFAVASLVGRMLRLQGLEAIGVVVGTLTVFVLMRSIRQW
jgi:hypothetical protein